MSELASAIVSKVTLRTIYFVPLIVAGLSYGARAEPSGVLSPVPPAVVERHWLDASRESDERAESLLQAMTLAEKIGQMQQMNGIAGELIGNADERVSGNALYEQIRQGQLGSVLNEVHTETINALQKVAVEESRLGVPLIFGRDVIHGFRTIFPIPLGQAASWNPPLVEAAAHSAAREARSQGVHWTFAPMVDVARDPRWGRIAESPGEDPYLASQLSAAMVHGFQGDEPSSPDRIAACAKHFACYGAAEGGRDYNSTTVSPSLLHNVYLPPFHAAVDAGAATIMTSFNTINGVPASAHRYLLHDVLRKGWGFTGFVVSDWTAIDEMIAHGYATDLKSAAELAAKAGVNMEMASAAYHEHLADLVSTGSVAESLIDQLVVEVLRVKFQLGLFEHPYVVDAQDSPLLSAKHLQLARQLARHSVVLLKNENQALPLDRSKIKTLAIIGPLADARHDQLGCWVPDGKESDSLSLLAAIRESAGDQIKILHAAGLSHSLDRSTDGFPSAVQVARQADVVLLAVGEPSNISGEAHSRASIDLPGAQNKLVETISAVGKPTVLIVQAGRPLTIARQIEPVDAVLYSFHAGTMAGPALADLLWGVESPSGKLPVTFPKTVGQIPLYYNHCNTGRPPRTYAFAEDRALDDTIDTQLGYNSNYIDVGPYPLFPFGYGLSYAEFQYGVVTLSSTTLQAGETLQAKVSVKNSGRMAGTEVVQLYVRDKVGSITRPVRELKGFRRVRIESGETATVEFELTHDDLAFFNNNAQRVVEPGWFEVFVGGSSLAPLAAQFEVEE